MRILKLIIMILSVFLSAGYGLTFLEMMHTFDINLDSVRYFIIGFSGFIPLWFFYMKDKHFYSTFEHELTHLLVGLIFLKKPAHFTVTSHSGGETGLYGGNFIITLAPYFLPTLAFIMLPFYLIINKEFQLQFMAVFGFIVSYHVFSTIQEFSYSQPDITNSGKVFSTLFLIFANILVYGYILMFIANGFETGTKFLVSGMMRFFGFIGSISNVFH